MLGIPPDLHETEQAKNLETKTDNRNDLLQNQISTSQSFPDTQSLPKLSPRGSYFINKIIFQIILWYIVNNSYPFYSISQIFLAVSNSLLSPVSPSMEVYMCTRSTPGSITYEKCDHISTIDYTKVSSTKKFILQETHSAPLLSDIEGSQCRGQKTEQGKS